MERLTYQGTKEVKPDVTIKQVTDLLAKYEDTGLSPGEIMQLKELYTAKKTALEGDGYDDDWNIIYDTWLCPNCGKHYEIDYDDYAFCPNCGQKIDWSDVSGEEETSDQ